MACESKDVRVELLQDDGEWVEIPTIDEGVTTHIRQQGSADFTYLSDVYFPAGWDGTDYSQYVAPLNDIHTSQVCRVKYRQPHDDTFQTVHWGYARQVGSADGGQKMRLQIGDFANFLGKIPASNQFSGDIDEVLNYVAEQLESEITFVDSVETSDFTIDRPVTYLGNTFTANEHTLLDVMNWLTEEMGGIWWVTPSDADSGFKVTFALEPYWADEIQDLSDTFDVEDDDTEGSTLENIVEGVFENAMTRAGFGLEPNEELPGELSLQERLAQNIVTRNSYTEIDIYTEENGGSIVTNSELAETVTVVENQALFQLQPINQVTVYGDSPTSINTPVGDMVLESSSVPSRSFPIATATYDPLNSDGESALSPPIIEASTSTLESTRRKAKRELTSRLSEATGGQMTLLGHPFIRPLDIVETRMACDGRIQFDTPQLDYEIEAVKHVCPASERYTTEVDVQLYAREDDISITDEIREA